MGSSSIGLLGTVSFTSTGTSAAVSGIFSSMSAIVEAESYVLFEYAGHVGT
jgi:hypothetical protein